MTFHAGHIDHEGPGLGLGDQDSRLAGAQAERAGAVPAPFGWEVVIDLAGCDPGVITSRSRLREFVVSLCDDILRMRRVGEPVIEWCGTADKATEGYSLVQIIETSSVVGHFVAARGSAYLNVFSCRPFDHGEVVAFVTRFLGAADTSVTSLTRY